MTYDDYIADRSGKDKSSFLTRAEYNRLSKTKSYWSLVNMSTKRKRKGSSAGRSAKRFRKGFDRTAGQYKGGSAGELKWIDVDLADSTLAAGGVFLPTNGDLPLIAAGTGESQRVGRKVWIKKILMKYSLILAATAGATINPAQDRVRVILYHDKQCNGAIPAAAIILQTVTVNGFRNMENIGRFNILYDKIHVMNCVAAAGDGAANDSAPMARQGKFYKNCNIPIEYSGTAGTIGEIRSNNLCLLVVANNAEATAIEATIRLRYLD